MEGDGSGMQPSPEEEAEAQRKNCIFCHIISGQVQSKRIYEDESCVGILDINPANPGHVLLLPREHHAIMPQMADPDVRHLFVAAKAISASLLKALGAEGTDIFVANGTTAGQKAPHVMIHIIPRKKGDGIAAFDAKPKKAAPAELAAIAARLRPHAYRMMGKEPPAEKALGEAASPVPPQPTTMDAEFTEEKDTSDGMDGKDRKDGKGDDATVGLDDIAKVLFR
ncbi:HIT family protein [Candidatus Woesearchaeota archaeon]|nr:HIT family protein [Candidatus Woesearchaeota archaeon]